MARTPLGLAQGFNGFCASSSSAEAVEPPGQARWRLCHCFAGAVYQECLGFELGMQGIPFVAQQGLALTYKGRPLEAQYVADFICFGLIIIELKAVTERTDTHRAQLHNYVKAADLRLGLLINFGHHPKIEIERYVR